MSVIDQITRLQNARNKIREKLVAWKLVESTAKLDTCADAIDAIENHGGITKQVKEGETYTIPKGLHDGTGTVSGVAGGGNYKLQSKTVTPSKNAQAITPDEGNYGLSDVQVGAIPEKYQDVSTVTAGAGDVLSPKIIVLPDGTPVAGTIPSNGAINETIDGINNTSVQIPAGYTTGGKVSLTSDIENALADI